MHIGAHPSKAARERSQPLGVKSGWSVLRE